MAKKIASTIIALCLIAALAPTATRAAVSPHFMAVNDTLLAFGDDTMPIIIGGIIFVPHDVFALAGVRAATSGAPGHVRLYAGARRLDFFADWGVTEDQHENTLNWPPAHRHGGKIYVPLHQVCCFFDLSYTLIEVGRDVIPNAQIWVVRIISSAALTNESFVSLHRNEMAAAYEAHYGPAPSDGGEYEEPPPDYSDITIYLGFYDISAGAADEILDLLESQEGGMGRACFFVSAGEIAGNAGLIRKIYSSGHAVGIWLNEDTHEEYLEASALLFEAAKIKTVLVSSAESFLEAASHELIYWPTQTCEECGGDIDVGTEETPGGAAIAGLPTESGARHNLMLPCSESTASTLPMLLAHLRSYGYTTEQIVEPAVPVQHECRSTQP